MGERHDFSQKNGREISSGELRRGGPCGPIIVDIFQRVKKDMWQAFLGMEKVLRETFLPRIFFGKSKTLTPFIGALSTFPVKKYRLDLQNPMTAAKDKYKVCYVQSTRWLVKSRASRRFKPLIPFRRLKGRDMTGKNDRDVTNDSKLRGIVRNQGASKKRLLLRAKHMGACMSVRGTKVTGTLLYTTKFNDFYVIVITLTPLNSKINTAVSCKPFWCVMPSSAAT